MAEKHKKNSKFLSLLLRHKPEELNLDIDSEGWVSVEQLIKNSNKRFTKTMLEEIVQSDSKGRYEFDTETHKNKIRARQGHSTESVKVTFDEVMPPSILYHGTSIENYKKILESREIKPGSRHYVHLSGSIRTATEVGKRHGECHVIKIDCDLMIEDGYKFYLSNNDVWLIESVPVKYFIFTKT